VAPAIRPPRYVGQRIRRKEDARLLTGRARHVADIRLPGTLHAAVLRSSFPHARITEIDPSRALQADGVVAVITARDLAGRVGPYKEPGMRDVNPVFQQKVELELKPLPIPLLADGEVFWVGQPVAVLVARDRYVAEDALQDVEVEYDPLPALTDPEEALSPEAPVLHPELSDNVAAHFVAKHGDVERALAESPHVLRHTFSMGRIAGNAMETRGVLATFDPGRRELTVYDANARPHLVRGYLSDLLGLPADSIRVIGPDMGGSFGTGFYPEDVLIPFLAMELGRPVRWLEDRQENLANTRHARDQIHQVEVGYDDEGRITAFRDRYVVDSGAYNPYVITVSFNTATHLRGQYAIDTFWIEGTNVLTNKAPVTPVRGAGRPEAVLAIDRALNMIADEVGVDQVEIRLRNLIRPEAMPYPMHIAYRDGIDVVYDRADYPAQLQSALELFGYHEWLKRQEEWRAEGRKVGVGVSSYVEGSGFGPHEGAVVRVDPSGHVSVFTGAKPHGQSLETTLSQVCADQLGVAPEQVTVRAGDTGVIRYGVGTFASRSAVTAGTAVGVAAGQLRERVLAVAGAVLEVDPADLELEDGRVFVRGTPERSLSLKEVAEAATPGPRSLLPEGLERGLEAEFYFVPPTVTFGSGTHVVGVEVDEETGFVKVLRYVTVDDCGRMLNPMIVEGQIHGGVAHGIGNALLEEAMYDGEGQFLTGTYMDYLLPTAAEVPPITIGHQEFLSELNPFGIKGVGEGGAVSPPAAIANAVADALKPLRVDVSHAPLSPERLLRLIEGARQGLNGTGTGN
jgi:carbon-monoxide dehydrogenase large subunit